MYLNWKGDKREKNKVKKYGLQEKNMKGMIE